MFLALSAAMLPVPAGAETPLVQSLERLAGQGNAEALYHLGMMYHLGSGLPQDHAKAFATFQQSAELGDPLGAYKLGCYFDGQGEGVVERDPARALQYKLLAARAGYSLAQQDVAALYGRSGDLKAALSWLERSAAQGWSGALAGLAGIHNGAPGIESDPAKVAGYFRLFLARTEASEPQRAWLSTFEKRMTAEQRAAADEMVRTYREQPSSLTLKALAGERAALALIARAN